MALAIRNSDVQTLVEDVLREAGKAREAETRTVVGGAIREGIQEAVEKGRQIGEALMLDEVKSMILYYQKQAKKAQYRSAITCIYLAAILRDITDMPVQLQTTKDK